MTKENIWKYLSSAGRTLLLIIGALSIVGAPLVAWLRPEDGRTWWVMMLSGCLAVIVTRLGDVVELSIGPLRARMREAVSRAEGAVDSLKKLAIATTRALSAHVLASYYTDYLSMNDRIKILEEIERAIDAMDMSAQEKELATAPWKEFMPTIYCNRIEGILLETASPSYAEFRSLKGADRTADGVRNFLSAQKGLDSVLAALVDDYAQFERTGRVQRKDLLDSPFS